MSHIQLFFEQYLPDYYFQCVTSKLDNPDFLATNNPHNIFNLTTDLILSAHKCIKTTTASPISHSIASEWIISYASLQKVNLPVEEGDNKIIACFKTKLKYVRAFIFRFMFRCSKSWFDWSCALFKAKKVPLTTILFSNISRKLVIFTQLSKYRSASRIHKSIWLNGSTVFCIWLPLKHRWIMDLGKFWRNLWKNVVLWGH